MSVSRLLLQASANALPLRDESVQCVVTSPPYWGLRQYAGEQTVAWPDGSTHPLGLEPTPELYVHHMVEVFREVRRVLRADGTLWLNLGDTYAAQRGGTTPPAQTVAGGVHGVGGVKERRGMADGYNASRNASSFGLKHKDLVGIPWMVAFALRADGWYLRSDIIWAKPNPMPESVTDRPTKAHEYLFLLSKSERYFYDAAAIAERSIYAGHVVKASDPDTAKNGQKGPYGATAAGFTQHDTAVGETRNRRTVWNIATRPYPGAHFATFPEDLVEPCILAGSSPQACGVCSAPWERVQDIVRGERDDAGRTHSLTEQRQGKAPVPERGWESVRTTTGWRPTCAHDDGAGASTILDPFNGSGTTGRVAIRHGRSYVGVDISREYLAEQATKRIDNVQHVMGGLA